MFNLLELVWLELAGLIISWYACLFYFSLVWLVWWLVLLLFALRCLACLLCFAMQRYAMAELVSFTWRLARLGLSQLGLSPLGLLWLGMLASWHALDFEQKNSSNLSERAPTRSRFKVEHDFKKTRVPREILK